MRHPFDGVEAPTHSRSRRAWLKGLLAAFAGLFVWRSARARCTGPPPAVFVPDGGTVVRREAGGRNDPEPFDHNPSTGVRGEEGASVGPGAPPLGGLRWEVPLPRTEASTLAFGEE